MIDRCPGSKGVKSPTIDVITCPECGGEAEIFSDEHKTKCPNCGKTIFREADPSCIYWCKYAKECIGEEKYDKIKGSRG